MFELEYCSNPNVPVLFSSNIVFDNEFEIELEEKITNLDNFIFLIDMYKIIESCAEDIQAIKMNECYDFWKINKVFFNFANAVYSYKEYVGNYKLSSNNQKKVSLDRQHRKKNELYNFMCSLRNYIIHQTVIIKDYGIKDDIFLDIDDISKKVMMYRYQRKDHEDRAKKFVKLLQNQQSYYITIENKHYLSIKKVVLAFMIELENIKKEFLMNVYNNVIEEILEWILNLIPKIENQYQYAFIVKKENIAGLVYEPNYILEDFIGKVIKSLGEENDISKEISMLLKKNEYTNFFDDMHNIQNFVNSI